VQRALPCVQQPPGSNSCLPSAVLPVLMWHHDQQTPDSELNLETVSRWCGETDDGCLLDLAMTRLDEAGWTVEDHSDAEEEEIRRLLRDDDHYAPLVVTVMNPYLPASMDHAVVLFDVLEEGEPGRNGIREMVAFMDQLTGNSVAAESGFFWQCWDFAGRRAFRIRR
jgi:hypothetical protein